MKYTIRLQFERIAPVDDELACRFLSCLAHICSFRCATDITFQVVSVSQSAPLNLSLVLDVEPTGLQTLTDADIRYNGASSPERVRSASVLYLWIASLRRLMDGPMTAAWRTFRGVDNRERSPIVLDKWLVEPPREYLILPLRSRTQSTETFYTSTST